MTCGFGTCHGFEPSADKSSHLNWRRVEVQALYLLSFEPCVTSLRDFSVIQKISDSDDDLYMCVYLCGKVCLYFCLYVLFIFVHLLYIHRVWEY